MDIDKEKVIVKCNVQHDAFFKTVVKIGKKTEYWESAAGTAESKPTETVAVA